jgi:hypothetical protein
MKDNVTPLKGSIQLNADKQTLLDTLASSIDQLMSTEEELAGVVFSVVGVKGATQTGYHTLNKVMDRNTLYISRGVMAINGSFPGWDL